MKLRTLPPTLVAIVVFACNPSKENETAEGTGPLEETHGHSSQSGTATGGGTAGTTTPDPTTGFTTGEVTVDPTTAASVPTTADPSGVTTSTAGEPECVPELPGLESCKAFIVAPDLGEVIQCDTFVQTCPFGEKCNAWSSDGDGSWDATKCVPVDRDPDPIGAPCTAEGDGVSGVDSCVNGAMCWNVDEQTGIGTCIEQCTCEHAHPICLTPNTTCQITHDGAVALCMPVCDPLEPGSCSADEVCVANTDDRRPFVCVAADPQAGGEIGGPCESANGCDPALVCGDPALLPGLCDHHFAGCCIPFCDLSAVDCPPGASCLPWHEPNQAPKCFAGVGVCGVEP